MWSEIATWQERLNLRPDLSTKTIALYTQDQGFTPLCTVDHLN